MLEIRDDNRHGELLRHLRCLGHLYVHLDLAVDASDTNLGADHQLPVVSELYTL